MGERYKSIKFKDFSGGGEQIFLEDQASFSRSYKINLGEANSIRLAALLNAQSLAMKVLGGSGCNNMPLFYENGGYNYLFVLDLTTAIPKLLRSSGSGAFTLKYTFSTENGLDNVYMALSHNNYHIVCFDDSVAGKTVWYASTDPTAGWAQIASLLDIAPVKNLIVDNKLYIVGTKDLYQTTDGLTYTPMNFSAQLKTNDVIQDALYFENFWYLVVWNNKEKLYHFMKIENATLKSILNSKQSINLEKTRNFMYISTNSPCRIYTFDGEELIEKYNLTNFFPTTYNFRVMKAVEDRIYFNLHFLDPTSAHEKNCLFSIINDKGIFLEFDMSDDEMILFVVQQDNVLYLGVENTGASPGFKVYNDYSATGEIFQPTGYAETSIISEGEIVPKQIILRHDKLDSHCSVKVYKDFDRSGTYTLILTSNTASSIKKKYAFPAGTILDFAQFKIELITTDSSKTPEDIELEFLYLPVGLANAK